MFSICIFSLYAMLAHIFLLHVLLIISTIIVTLSVPSLLVFLSNFSIDTMFSNPLPTPTCPQNVDSPSPDASNKLWGGFPQNTLYLAKVSSSFFYKSTPLQTAAANYIMWETKQHRFHFWELQVLSCTDRLETYVETTEFKRAKKNHIN